MIVKQAQGDDDRLRDKEDAAWGRWQRLADTFCPPPDYEPVYYRRLNARQARRIKHHIAQGLRLMRKIDRLSVKIHRAGIQELVWPGLYDLVNGDGGSQSTGTEGGPQS